MASHSEPLTPHAHRHGILGNSRETDSPLHIRIDDPTPPPRTHHPVYGANRDNISKPGAGEGNSTRPSRQSSFLNLALGLTPLNSQSRRQFRQSYENLVALANAREALENTRRMVWRDRGEPAADLESLEECFEHALKGGARAGGLGYGIRSGVNIFLLMFRIFKTPKSFRLSLIRHALLGPDSFQFAAMLGTFVALYKLLLNALPLFTNQLADFSPPLLPFSTPATPAYDSDNGRYGLLTPGAEKKVVFELGAKDNEGEEVDPKDVKTKLSRQAKVHELWIRKKGRRWHAALAGGIAGGLAVLWEKKERRLGIAQQLFVRGLQGAWNSFSEKRGITVPFGSVIVFAACCGQIMYSWLLEPERIPRSYSTWISQASKVSEPTVRVNRAFTKTGRAEPADMQALVDWSITTPYNKSLLLQTMNTLASSPLAFERRFANCSEVHPWLDNCYYVQVERFLEVFKWMFPIYGALHFVPALLFKRKEWSKNFAGMFVRNLLGTARSSTFLGVFVIIYQSYFCGRNNLYEFLSKHSLLQHFRANLMGHKFTLWLVGALCGLSLLVEAPRRRAELAMYVMPKALESAWVSASGRGLVREGGRAGEVLLTAAGMGLVMSTYQNDPQHLSGLVRRILYQFIGPN